MPELLPRDGEWDLRPLYASPDSPQLSADLARCRDLSAAFRSRFRGRIAEAGADLLLEAAQVLAELRLALLPPICYAYLLYSAASNNDSVKAFYSGIERFENDIARELVFFEVEVARLPEETVAAVRADARFANYRHFILSLLKFREHVLPEREEELLTLKKLAGPAVLARLFEELESSLTYPLRVRGEDRVLTGEEIRAFSHSEDRALREEASAVYLGRHAEHAVSYAAVFDGILLDHSQEIRLRGYADPMQPTNLGNEIPDAVVAHLLDVSEANYPLAQEYFALKGRLLGIPRMKTTDLYAPYEETSRTFTLEEARELVLEGYRRFDPGIAAIVAEFFSGRRIDLFPRTGKRGGAFCMGISPAMKPYVLANFTGRIRDVSTLAHELGHGVHFVLASRQNILDYYPPLPLAEVASVFGELLLIRFLTERADDPQLYRQLLASSIEDILATTLRQTVLTRFEQRIHHERAAGLVTASRMCEIWTEENRKLYGEAVELTEPYRWGWTYISHFINSRFYCYAYVFAELLALSLFRRYEEEGDAFVPKYREILGSGGSRSPAETAALGGVDIAAEHFWQGGYDILREEIERFRALAEPPAVEGEKKPPAQGGWACPR